MHKFQRSGLKRPSFSAIPMTDIVIVILCMCLGVLSVRQVDKKLEVELLDIDQKEQLTHRWNVHHIAIGKVKRQPYLCTGGRQPIPISINDKIAYVEDVQIFADRLQYTTPAALRSKLITNLKVDENIPMGLVHDVKNGLRKGHQFKVNYVGKTWSTLSH